MEDDMLGRHVYRVKPKDENNWTVLKDGEDATRGERRRRNEAVDFACELAAADEPSKVVVERGDGTIDEERVFGIDQGQLVDGLLPENTQSKSR
jgi:uncharacterized protein DUF2188